MLLYGIDFESVLEIVQTVHAVLSSSSPDFRGILEASAIIYHGTGLAYNWDRRISILDRADVRVPVISESGSVTNDCTSLKDAAKVNGFGVVVGLLPAFHVIHSCLTLFIHIPLLLNTH